MKKSVVAVYTTHEEAVESAKMLLDKGYQKNDVSIVGKMEDMDGDVTIPSGAENKPFKPAAIGSSIGVATGVLTGIGIFAIPGLGFLYGAGALVGAIAGFDFGLIAGGMVSLAEVLTGEEHKHSLSEYLSKNYHVVVYMGSEKDEVEKVLKDTDPVEVFH